ncbi:MAG: hypothetical protein HQK51_21005, partial [Oligoflexia bacterium]|nr:hypothetical protein [Oligoflexia bacterium]
MIARDVNLRDVCELKHLIGKKANLYLIKELKTKNIETSKFIEVYQLLVDKFQSNTNNISIDTKDALDILLSTPNVNLLKDIIKINPDLDDIGKLKLLVKEVIFPQELKLLRLIWPEMTLGQIVTLVENKIPLIEYIELKKLWPEVTHNEVSTYLKWGGNSEMAKRTLKKKALSNFQSFFSFIRSEITDENNYNSGPVIPFKKTDGKAGEFESDDIIGIGTGIGASAEMGVFQKLSSNPSLKDILGMTNLLLNEIESRSEYVSEMKKISSVNGNRNSEVDIVSGDKDILKEFKKDKFLLMRKEVLLRKVYPLMIQVPFRTLEIKDVELDNAKVNHLFEKKVHELIKFKDGFCSNLIQKINLFQDLSNEEIYSYIFNEYIKDTIHLSCDKKSLTKETLLRILRPTMEMLENFERDPNKTILIDDKKRLHQLTEDLITYL